jgi:hypothetical protein
MEVPPNIEAKPTVSPFSTLFLYSSNPLLLWDDSKTFLFPVPGRPLAITICMILVISSGQKRPDARSQPEDEWP